MQKYESRLLSEREPAGTHPSDRTDLLVGGATQRFQ
jgi:hypothetical protein